MRINGSEPLSLRNAVIPAPALPSASTPKKASATT